MHRGLEVENAACTNIAHREASPTSCVGDGLERGGLLCRPGGFLPEDFCAVLGPAQ